MASTASKAAARRFRCARVGRPDSSRIDIGSECSADTRYEDFLGETPGSQPISALNLVLGLVRSDRAFWHAS
ncbi:hypothetical protein D9M71_828150 [compost metagenome]